MTSSFESSQLPATEDQSRLVLEQVGRLTTLRGRLLGPRSSLILTEAEVDIPAEVSEHFADVDSASKGTRDAVSMIQNFDFKSGAPLTAGGLGNVSSSRTEFVDDDLNYTTTVNYHLLGNDGRHELERHVRQTEGGTHRLHAKHALERRIEADPRDALARMDTESLQELERAAAARPLEKKMGILVVSKAEAQAVLDYLSSIKAVE